MSMVCLMKETTTQKNDRIASLDPLQADAMLAKLPQMNLSGDLKNLISTLEKLIPNSEQIESYSLDKALAVVRDLGILAGSVKKHGIEPIVAVPQLEGTLLDLGRKTDMVPRDTLLHYSLWNPQGERQRKYTVYADEIEMVNSARISIPRLEKAINDLVLLREIPLDSADFAGQCQNCADNLNGMVEAIVHTIKHVSRQVFAEQLRPYFDSITVRGKEYLGPGAVEMPLFIFDHLFWSAECRDESYLQFKQDFLPYILPSLRQLYLRFEKCPSLVAQVSQQLQSTPRGNSTVITGVNNVMKIFKIIIKFRKPHIKVVDQAYMYAENNVRDRGSGGYRSDMLYYLATLTDNATIQFSQAIDRYTQLSLIQKQ
jgi:monodechloroaminopyrrolnitrin synthase